MSEVLKLDGLVPRELAVKSSCILLEELELQADIGFHDFEVGTPQRLLVTVEIWLKDVVVTQDRSPMGAGYMSLDKGEMQWTLTYDEIDIVLEGELVITRGSEQVRGKTGDVIYIPKGSSITFGTPSWTKFVYVVFPVNWNEK